MYSYRKSSMDFSLLISREIQPTLLWRKTELWQRMELMLSARTLGVLCHGTQLRKSSSALVMDPSTMIKGELLEDLHLW